MDEKKIEKTEKIGKPEKGEKGSKNEKPNFEHSAYDDFIIEKLKSNDLKLNVTDTRKRQMSCSIREVKKDELPNYAKNFVPSKKITLKKILQMDSNDISLTKYKKALLGPIVEENIKENELTEVEILKIILVCPDRKKGNIELNFEDGSGYDKSKDPYILKEGSVTNLRVVFKVKNDCVYGLKFVNNVYKHFMKVEKYDEMMGSFAPKKEIQTADLPGEETPSGF